MAYANSADPDQITPEGAEKKQIWGQTNME